MKQRLRTLLVDDERLARKRLCDLLAEYEQIEIVGQADSVEVAAQMAAKLRPEVVFLDVQMPPKLGFDLLPLLSGSEQIVFVTAYDLYAVRAFEAAAVDYLLKPVSPERLALTIRRLAGQAPSPSEQSAPVGTEELILLRDGHRYRMAAVDSLAAILAEGGYTKVLLDDEAKMLVFRPITQWESILPSPPFARLDRSNILHIGKVKEINSSSRDECRVRLSGVKEEVVLGRSAWSRLKKLL